MSVVGLVCAAYGETSVFRVKIALSRGCKGIYFSNPEQFSFPACALTLYLAKEKSQWVQHDSNTKDCLRAGMTTEYKEILSSWTIKDKDYFLDDFKSVPKDIHIFALLPHKLQLRIPANNSLAISWSNSQRTSHTRNSRRKKAFWYEESTLIIQVIFKFELKALEFQNCLFDDPYTIGSPLYGQTIDGELAQVEISHGVDLFQIHLAHYQGNESDLPQDEASYMSSASNLTLVYELSDEYRY
ncbi:hypothetical protein THRCLA_20854 [Thraustotheca clavata]|uniref:Crinkler effector protein N-terminal domain-containing protein n=1 Tax=Thraustotheca clavata TaxID=74557 RepID=A0A1W0A2R8_9STRA|nr:hypothetical protein THRCLA_20854 [Thraustotheca clavata]